MFAVGDYLQLIKATQFQHTPFLQIIKFGSDINNPAFYLSIRDYFWTLSGTEFYRSILGYIVRFARLVERDLPEFKL